MRRAVFLQPLVLTIGAMLVAIPAAHAQPDKKNYLEGADNAAPDEDTARPPAWRVQVTAGTEQKEAKASVNLFSLSSITSASGNGTAVSDQSLELSVTTPFDKKSDSLPASLDGLANGTKFSLDYSFWGSKRNAGITDVQQQLWDKAVQKCLADRGRKIGATAANFSEKCNDSNDSQPLIGEYLERGEQRDYAAGSFQGGLTAFGLTASIGVNDYTFADPAQLALNTITPVTQRKTGWSLGGRFAYYLRESPTAISLGVDYERSWRGADAVTLCPPSSGGIVQCPSIAPTAPVQKDSVLFKVNLRHRFGGKGDSFSNFAISPRFTYALVDGKKDVWGAELPLYFIPDGKGGLTGGVKVGYRSDTDKVSFGVFIGTTFGLVQ